MGFVSIYIFEPGGSLGFVLLFDIYHHELGEGAGLEGDSPAGKAGGDDEGGVAPAGEAVGGVVGPDPEADEPRREDVPAVGMARQAPGRPRRLPVRRNRWAGGPARW